MHMYHRNMTKSKVSVLDTEDYDKLFDNKYGNIKSLNFGTL